MANDLDYTRLSDFVRGIVNPQMRAISLSVTGASGYLRGMVSQSQAYAQQSLGYSNNARDSATQADTSATSAQIVYNDFTSTYLGLNDGDPVRSKQGNTVNVGAIFIRKADGRLRYVTGVDGSGNPIWNDATLLADISSIANAGAGVFLSLQTTGAQTVKSAVTFQSSVSGSRITSWTSNQFTTAADVNDRVTTTQNNINNEINRATAAENALSSSKVNKGGDTLSGILAVAAAGDQASYSMRETSASGRTYRINSSANGFFRLIDDTAGAERFVIDPNGYFTVRQGMNIQGQATSTQLVVNRTDSNDSVVIYQTGNVTRWTEGRSFGGKTFYIARYNAAGVYIDTPFQIAESDGSISLNRTVVNDTLSTKGNIRVDSNGAFVTVNTIVASNDAGISIQNVGVTRWNMGRSSVISAFYINRYSDQGQFVETPFSINESNGWVVVNNQQVKGTLQVLGVASAPVFYATANGNGKAISVGDDAWIGDGNIPNGLSIRGQGDFNSGYIQFGASGSFLGCDSNSSDLKYGGQLVLHTGNFNIDNYFSFGSNANGYWERRRNGVIEQWGQVTYNVSEGNYTITFPINFTDASSIVVSPTIINSVGDNRYDLWIQVRSVAVNSCVVYVQYPGGGGNINLANGIMWRAIGR